MDTLAAVQAQIRRLEREIAEVAKARYPETAGLRKITGVGPLTSLTFVLTVEDPKRFRKSRSVGSWVGLCPRVQSSGDRNPQLPISKAGDSYLRRLLVQSAQYILGPFGPDCDLKRFGLRLCARGASTGKKRAVIAVARKLTVLMHRLWVTGSVYDPFFNANQAATN